MNTNLEFKDIIKTFNYAHKKYNKTLSQHSEEVSYLTLEICNAIDISNNIKSNLIIAAYLHNVVSPKCNYVEHLHKFEIKQSPEHSKYSYIFFDTLIPSNSFSKYILYHHAKFNSKTLINDIPIPKESNILKLADDISLFITFNKNIAVSDVLEFLEDNKDNYNPEYLNILLSKKGHTYISNLLLGTYKRELPYFRINFNCIDLNLLDFINMVAFLIDLKCDITNIHSLAVSNCSVLLCKEFNLSPLETEEVLIGSLLHDVGKISTPDCILKKPGKLTNSEYLIMKKHVNDTYDILKNLNNQRIVNIASNHHEKLNGTGYPRGITDLSLQERIVAVADIFVALIQKRSYKDSFCKEKTIEILLNSVENGELDKNVVDILIKKYEYFIYNNIKLYMKYDNLLKALSSKFLRMHN